MADFDSESKPKSTTRRDKLRSIEIETQKKWQNSKINETERVYDEFGKEKPKFLVTFPYPYMNGRLH